MSLAQLRELGRSARQVERAVERNELRALHRGVYLLGPLSDRYTLAMAAVLACGPRAFLSHRSAAALHRLLPHPAGPEQIDVAVAGANPGEHPGIRLHRPRSIEPHERCEVRGIPVTSPVRTILDLAGSCSPGVLERAVSEAIALHLVDQDDLGTAIREARGRRGVARLRLLLDLGPARTRSTPERRLLRLIRDAGLPRPATNTRLGRWEVDFLWRSRRLVVEVDAYGTHGSPWAFERDRRKDAELGDAGYRVHRITARQIADQPYAVVARVRRLLTVE